MRRRNLDFVTPWFARVLHKARVVKGVSVGDLKKSWDVLKTLEFLEQHVSKSTPVLDLGAYASEILCNLYKMGFSDLTGIDLNPRLMGMPYQQNIKYLTGDFTHTAFSDETFGAITAISVVEHGFCGPQVFREASRILKNGGYLVGSTDYWPEKIDTSGVTTFGLEWTIFSKDEILDLIKKAANNHLVPVGALNLEASKPTVRWLKRHYTFAWFAFQKVDGHPNPIDQDALPT
jgi:SAM-dependent methyltransferase